jgi:Leucine-rich repeat (LRR) protein
MFRTLIWCLLGTLFIAQSQNISFADTNFKKALLAYSPKIDTDSDKEINTLEAEAVKELKLAHKKIKSLAGIEHFVQLQTLDCSSNQLESVSFSGNGILSYLDCSSNQLTSLDMSENTHLHDLYCEDNQLSDLKVLSDTRLANLYCDSNKFVSMDLSFGSLVVLYCSHNPLLSSLDLRANDFLRFLTCKNNPQLSIICVKASQSRTYWKQDPTMSYSTDCATTEYDDTVVDNVPKEISKMYNLQGQEVSVPSSEVLIYLYRDGTRGKAVKVDR